MWAVNLRGADVVFAFVLPDCLEHLKSKWSTELQAGARIVVLGWPVTGWKPVISEIPPEGASIPAIGRKADPAIYIYRIGRAPSLSRKVEGN